MTLLKRRNGETALKSIFSDFFNSEKFFDTDFFTRPWYSYVPATNIRETEKEFFVEVAAPGMKKNDFHIDIEEGMLRIRAEKETESNKEEDNYTRREYNYNSFERTFQIPNTVNVDSIGAKYEDGVLRLMLPKKKEARSKPKKEVSIS